MLSVVVPFRAGGKTRLPVEIRREAALAMLGDVLAAAVVIGPALVVTDDEAGENVATQCGARPFPDPGGGQGAAVEAALAQLDGPVLVVNADVPRIRPSDLNALGLPAQAGALSLVEAGDGTTNALGLPYPEAFASLYGPGSAARFRAHAAGLGLAPQDLALQNLIDDVDTAADLERIGRRAGARTRALLAAAGR